MTTATLEQLESDVWPAPEYSSSLVRKCHQLRKKPLAEFEVEDLRIMLGQQIGEKHLVPLALERLSENILAEGDFYEGDLLNSVLRLPASFWKANFPMLLELKGLLHANRDVLETFDTTESIREELLLGVRRVEGI